MSSKTQPEAEKVSAQFPQMAAPSGGPQAYGSVGSGVLSFVHPEFSLNDPQMATCPTCQHQGLTNVQLEAGTKTFLTCCGLCICCRPLAILVCCIDDLKDATHNCYQCGGYIGGANKPKKKKNAAAV